MVEAARAAGMRMFGPNAQGLANFGTGAVASFSTMFIEAPPADGPVGIISQSGAMSVIPYGLLRARGIGVRHAHATGNDAETTVCELATVVAEDPGPEAAAALSRGHPRPVASCRRGTDRARARAADRRAEVRPLARRPGRGPLAHRRAGERGPGRRCFPRGPGHLAREHGTEMVDAAALYLKGWRPQGRRLVSISNSGAVCVLSADAASDAGLSLAPLAEETQAELRTILPGFATTTNPVDITAALLTNSSLFGAILPAIGRDPAADAFFVGVAVAGAAYDVEAFARDSARFEADTGKPLVAAAPQRSVAERFEAHGVITFATESEAVRALGQFLGHAERAQRARIEDAPRPERRAAPAGVRMLDEASSLRVLAERDVPVVPHRLCKRAAEAREAFDALCPPVPPGPPGHGDTRVVVKGCSAQVAHKSELGIVRIGIDSADRVEAAYHDIVETLRERGRHPRRRDRRADGSRRARADGRRSCRPDLRTRCSSSATAASTWRRCPTSPGAGAVHPGPDRTGAAAAADRAVARRRARRSADGLAAFCRAAAAVGALVTDRSTGVTAVDINPVITGARGEGCVAVDAAVWREIAL